MKIRLIRFALAFSLGWVVLLTLPPEGFGQTGMPMDPPLFPNDTCKECHPAVDTAKPNYSDPECLECHLPPDEPMAVPTAIKTVAPPVPVNEMIRIPAGEFIIGNDGRTQMDGPGNIDETPRHRVYLDTYLMDKYEVTNAQYKAFTDATNHRTPKLWKVPVEGHGMTYPPEKADHPVVYVDWYDAQAYCHWAGKRLPSEQEWEKAARGTEGWIFPWGDRFDTKKANSPQRWLSRDQKGDTMPVGRFEDGKSPYGLYDMAGNVYEWTSSWYKPYPGNQEFNAHYGEKNKILRGGSWYDCLSYGCGLSTPTYNRSRFAPAIRNKGFGFRCAKSL